MADQDRDWIAEMSALIEHETAGGDWVPAIVAERIRDHLAVTDPDLLAGWLQTMAVHLLTDVIRGRERCIRSRERHRAASRTFGQAATAAAAGDTGPLGSFAVTYAIDGENTRRRVADMTGHDHRFVAGEYTASAKRSKLLASFHRAVANKAGTRRTAEVMTEDQYDRLYQSIVAPQGAPQPEAKAA